MRSIIERKPIFAAMVLILGAVAPVIADDRPNVVLVITDDQGYGDLSCHGNPVLQTPQLDQLYAESIRLTDYHVSPTCSPTRAALLTGHWTNRTGVWHTIMGRSMLREDETTIADAFSEAGYATGMFGKWHLGDNYPYRAEDRGFEEVMRHGGGGVGQTPDFWNNAYFDGSYWHNGTPTPVEGFCTDVFFDYAMQFIRRESAAQRPFFAYVATNAPHGPMHSPPEFSDPYSDQNVGLANFFGMIANIDQNMGRLRGCLKELGEEDNTIFIFTTDNGSSSGWRLFNAGMRAGKGSEFDGGHRVPLFVRWPDGGLVGPRDVTPITAHVDLFPTLLDLCGIDPPRDVTFDGVSLEPLLREPEVDWPDRILVTDSQRVKDPIKWRKSAVMTNRWRLINGQQLYDMDSDPGQQNDVADQRQEVVQRLRSFYEAWWEELEPSFSDETAIYLGHPAEVPARLTSHDWITTRMTPWNQTHIRQAMRGPENTGYWNVHVHQPGLYQIRLRRWPLEADAAINAGLPAGDDVPGQRAYRAVPGQAIQPTEAHVRIADHDVQIPVLSGQQEAVVQLRLPKGPTRLETTFVTEDGTVYGAYYAYVERVDELQPSVQPDAND